MSDQWSRRKVRKRATGTTTSMVVDYLTSSSSASSSTSSVNDDRFDFNVNEYALPVISDGGNSSSCSSSSPSSSSPSLPLAESSLISTSIDFPVHSDICEDPIEDSAAPIIDCNDIEDIDCEQNSESEKEIMDQKQDAESSTGETEHSRPHSSFRAKTALFYIDSDSESEKNENDDIDYGILCL
jgi:hypothetical protein